MAPKADNNKPYTGTDLVHADDHVSRGPEVAPSITVSTSKYLSSAKKSEIIRVMFSVQISRALGSDERPGRPQRVEPR